MFLIRKTEYLFISVVLGILLYSPANFSQTAEEVANAESFLFNPNLPFDSTATADDITSAYFNPAGIGIHPLQIGVFYANSKADKLNDYLLFLNVFGFAFSAQWRQAETGFNAQRFTIGTGIDTSNTFSIGTTYNWYHSSVSLLNNYSEWDIGLIFRPFRWVSLGTVARGLNLPVFQNVQIKPRLEAGIALRPIPKFNERLTLSADSIFYLDKTTENIVPRFTVEVLPVNGLTLYGGMTLHLTNPTTQDYYFGLKIAQNITQISFQGSIPHKRGQFYGGGVLVTQERFKTSFEAIKYYLEIPLNEKYLESSKGSFFILPGTVSFYNLLAAIQAAVKDPQITGIIVKADNFSGGWAQAEELRAALLQFQESSGKPVYAFITSGSNKDYYIATGANRIIMPPAGTLQLTGLKAEIYYLRGLFDLAGVEPDFINIGQYKSAPNMFTKKLPDKQEKEQMNEMLGSIQYEFMRGILTRRKKLKPEEMDKLFDEGIYTVSRAKEAGLIDDVMYYPEIQEKYLKIAPSLINWKIEVKNYLKTKIYDDNWGIKPSVALLVLEGEISEFDQNLPLLENTNNINLESTIKIINKIKTNPAVRSVVIRINSPGGSGLASDILWKEIRLLQQEKPVIISLGDTAASGGYYLAVGADEILSDQTSITGSIGVFFGKFSLKGLYKKLGIHKEVYKLNSKGAIFSESDVFSQEEKKLINDQMLDFYNLFLDRVQRSRTNLSKSEIEENAQGRVYTGAEAKKRGMVDKIGGLSLAIELAKNKAKIMDDHMDILVYPGNGENILTDNNLVIPLPKSIKSAIKILNESEKVGSSNNILFVMPYEFEIH